jgi:hypothetical protein
MTTMNRMIVVIVAIISTTVTAFLPHQPLIHIPSSTARSNNQSPKLYMVLEKPRVKEIAKIEQLKVDSNYLVHPLKEVTWVYFCLCCCVWWVVYMLYSVFFVGWFGAVVVIYFWTSNNSIEVMNTYSFPVWPIYADEIRKAPLSHKPVDISWSSTLIGACCK